MRFALLTPALLFFFSFAAFGAQKTHPAKASLWSDSDVVAEGTSFFVGLKMQLEPEWHVYWRNPGDSGTAPQVDWTLPPGFKITGPQWPAPSRIPIPPLENYGYEKEVLLPYKVTVPKNYSGRTFDIRGAAKWLVCREVCIPGKAEIAIRISTGPERRASSTATEFANVLAQMPQPYIVGVPSATRVGDKITLRLAGWNSAKTIHFFPSETGVLDHAAPQPLTNEAEAQTLELTVDPVRNELLATLKGVLVSSKSEGHPEAFELEVSVATATPTPGAPIPMESTSLSLMVLFAFLGGMILNLMPCVFPVLSIKILSFVHLSQKSPKKVQAHGWAYTLGVMVSFLTLAAILLVVRAGGQKLGWGFQLQSPVFVIAMTVIIFLLALSLLGLFDIGSRFMSLGSSVSHEGYRGSFFTGVLATVVATPCTAPLMGPAIGFALAQPNSIALLVFTALGAGMAVPYLVLSYSPSLLKALPKPGRWMETLKQFMAFPLIVTALWLGWVFGQQTGTGGMLRLYLALTSLSLIVWVLHRSAGSKNKPWLAWLTIVAGLVGFFYMAGTALQQNRPATSAVASADHIQWEKFSPERVKELNAKGTPMFIDFTAAWCVSCQVNESVAIEIESVRHKLKEKGVVTLKADWTDGDPIITETLEKFGRSGVPMYLVYNAGANSAPQILPEALTPGIVLEALDKIR